MHVSGFEAMREGYDTCQAMRVRHDTCKLRICVFLYLVEKGCVRIRVGGGLCDSTADQH